MAVTLLNPGGCEDDCYECGDCPVRWFTSDCRLFWYVPSPPAGGWTVTITHPDTSQDVYVNVQSAMIETPAIGTYSAVLTIDGTDYGPCEIAFAGSCSPIYPCCVRTSGIWVRVSPEVSGLTKGSQIRGSLYDYAEMDFTLLTHESLRVGSLSSGTKDETNCYDVWGTTEEFYLGSGYLTRFIGFPHGGSPPTCAAPGTNYYYQRIYYDFYAKYFTSTLNLVGRVTGEDFSIVGSPQGDAPQPPVIGGDDLIVQDSWTSPCDPLVTLNPSDAMTYDSDFFFNACDGSLNFVIERWPEIIPL